MQLHSQISARTLVLYILAHDVELLIGQNFSSSSVFFFPIINLSCLPFLSLCKIALLRELIVIMG
jgi:hypothetical protein